MFLVLAVASSLQLQQFCVVHLQLQLCRADCVQMDTLIVFVSQHLHMVLETACNVHNVFAS